MRLVIFIIFIGLLQACTKPLEPLMKLEKVALVSVKYDPSIYKLVKPHGIDFTITYSNFSGDVSQGHTHVMILNEFITNLMTDTVNKSGISIVRPLKLLNTSLMSDSGQIIQYEYLLKPYDPIDINNHVFMAGLANQLNVDAVAEVDIKFGIHLDEKTLWQEYNDPYAGTLNSKLLQLKEGHLTSELRTSITIKVVDTNADLIYEETRYVDSHSDQIRIDDRDLVFDGGVSPKLLQLGFSDWINDWVDYLPDYMDRI